ncbi:MAG: phosphatidylserine decarboxylase family protein [Bacteroidetes bacterium]|nr:phosphatidylserine decarboxylase family protein [Bacteroidota bacterium]
MTLHKEGFNSILVTIILLGLLNGGFHYFFPEQDLLLVCIGVLSLVFLYLILQFFRSPKRDQSIGDRLVIAPCDGKVVVIEQTTETEFYKDKRIQVSIFMSPLNVHINWYPISGIVKYLRYHEGKFLVAWHPKASTENERTTMVIEKTGFSVLVRQIAGAVAKRIVYYPHESDKVKQGSELGFIKFGSRVDLYLPLDAKINVAIGQKTTGGVTVIAEY